MLFEKQYILTETVTMQIRYRTKMMVIIGPYGVPQVITYQEPYEYYICTVKLKNKDLSHLPVEVLTEEQLSAYSLYMRTLGNRPDLFGQAQYPNASTIKQPTYYDIPPEALKDDKFAAMMEEATKYIGYPYVWGGSSPSTSFDCSGYISWVLNHSGWNVGRQTAQGLYNLCTPVSAAQVKPGDLVFFKGTYDTPGVSIAESMWVIPSCCTAATLSPTRISTQNIGRNIFTAMGVYRDARKDFVWQKDFPVLSATSNGSKKKSLNTSSS